ncbi:MAG: hypothetical protein IPI33_08535 [Dehalococcoidia bacterium]|nr:hypothetical protein [Dehalococcoidia bacterium]
MGTRILIICRGYLGSHMSAPGIRATAQASVLARHVPGAKVTLAGTNLDFEQPEDGAYTVTRWNARNILQLVAAHDIIISSMLPPHVAGFFPFKRFVVSSTPWSGWKLACSTTRAPSAAPGSSAPEPSSLCNSLSPTSSSPVTSARGIATSA